MFSLVVLVVIAAELSGSVTRVRRPDALIKWSWQPRSVMRVSSAQGNCTGSHSCHPVTLPVGQRTCTGQAGVHARDSPCAALADAIDAINASRRGPRAPALNRDASHRLADLRLGSNSNAESPLGVGAHC